MNWYQNEKFVVVAAISWLATLVAIVALVMDSKDMLGVFDLYKLIVASLCSFVAGAVVERGSKK